MGLFGKILLVVNLLASGGFVFLGVQDWSRRQTIQAAMLRHILLRDGIPLEGGPDTLPPRVAPTADGYADFVSEEIPFEVGAAGGVKTKTVSPELLYVYFNPAKDAGGSALVADAPPVASQMAEVKRVFGIIKSALEKADGPAAKAKTVEGWLLLQAENYEERKDYLDWSAKNNGPELMHELDLKFNRVSPKVLDGGALNPDAWLSQSDKIKALEAERDAVEKAAEDAKAAGNDAEAEKKRAEAGLLSSRIERRRPQPPKDEVDRRMRLAHLLVHLDQAAAWQKRVMMIVGVKSYVKAVDGQAGNFKKMLDRVEQVTVDEQERFVGEYALLRTMAIERTQLVLQSAELKAQLTLQASKDLDLVRQRTLQLEGGPDVDGLKPQLKTFKEQVNVLLAKQAIVEQKLFAIERAIGLTLEDIYRLEAELRLRERNRYEQKK